MPYIQISSFNVTVPNDCTNAPEAVTQYFNFIKSTEGYQGVFHGHQSDDKTNRYTITVWDSYENYAKLQTNEAFLTLVDSMKTLASSAASVQNMRIDVEDVPRILSGPLVQLVTVKAREEHTGEDILKVTQKMQDAVPKGAAGGFFAVGQVEDDTQTVMLLIPWKATVEDAKEGGVAAHPNPLVKELCAIGDMSSTYAVFQAV